MISRNTSKALMVILSVLIILTSGCVEDEGEVGPEQLFDQSKLNVIEVTNVPVVDGEVDDLWADTPELNVPLGETYDTQDPASITDCAGCHAYDSDTTVTLKALHNDTHLTVLATWPDPTASFTRGDSWSFIDGKWMKLNPEQSEDRISFFWPIGEIEGEPFDTGGCMAKCHMYYPTDTDPHVSTHGIIDDSWLKDGRADMWHSKAGRGTGLTSTTSSDLMVDPDSHEVVAGTISMIGYADDKYVDVWANDTVNGEDGGRYGDDGTSAYSHNRIADKSRPKYMEKDPLDFADAMVLTQAEIDAGETIGDGETGVSDEDAITYWPNYEALGAIVPERVLRTSDSSRADIQFGAVWKDGIWTAELGRDLINANEDDVQFNTSEEHFFGVAIFDNSRHGYQHMTSRMYYMKFV